MCSVTACPQGFTCWAAVLSPSLHVLAVPTQGLCRSPDGNSVPLPDRDAQSAFKRSTSSSIADFPLYCEGVDRARFAYAIYLLNKVKPACNYTYSVCIHEVCIAESV